MKKEPIPPMPEPEHVCDDGCLVEELAQVLADAVDPVLDDGAMVTLIVRWPLDPNRFIVVGNDEPQAMEKIAEAVRRATKPPARKESWQ